MPVRRIEGTSLWNLRDGIICLALLLALAVVPCRKGLELRQGHTSTRLHTHSHNHTTLPSSWTLPDMSSCQSTRPKENPAPFRDCRDSDSSSPGDHFLSTQPPFSLPPGLCARKLARKSLSYSSRFLFSACDSRIGTFSSSS